MFAGVTLYLLSRGGNIDLGGEKHGDGPMSGTPYFSSSGMIASVCGVPRVRNIAVTFCSSISMRAANQCAGKGINPKADSRLCAV